MVWYGLTKIIKLILCSKYQTIGVGVQNSRKQYAAINEQPQAIILQFSLQPDYHILRECLQSQSLRDGHRNFMNHMQWFK